MANLSSGPTQKRPGERDAGEDDVSYVSAKRSRRESPVGDWRDVHLKERERDRDRGGYDRRSSKRRDDDYNHHSSSRRDREYGRERDYRRRRSRSRSRSRSKTPPPPPAAVAPDDDEKEEGEISPRPSVPPPSSAKPASRRESPSRYGHPSSRHGHENRRRGDYRSRRSRSRTRSVRSRSRSVSTRARSRSPSRARYGSSFAKHRGGSVSRKESGYQEKGRVDKDRDVEMHDGTSATSATTSTAPVPANQAPAPPLASEEIKEPEEEKSIEEKLAERRRKRAEILAKHASGQSSTVVGGANGVGVVARATPGTMVSEALAKVSMMDDDGKPQPPSLHTPMATDPSSKVVTAAPSVAPQSRRESASPPPPSATAEFDLAKLEGKEDGAGAKEGDLGEDGGEGGGVGAADYDPSLDRREDERRRFGVEVLPVHGEGAASEKKDENAMAVDGDDGEVEEVEVTDEEEEDVDDMFAIALGGDEDEEKKEKKEKIKKKKKVKKPQPAPLIPHPSILVDSAADAEGYYTIILGEYLDNGRYQVFSSLGKGMFANVVRARVLKEEDSASGELVDVSGIESAGGIEGRGLREVAIKIVRCQEPMYKAGLKEAQILHKLRAMDQEDKKHVVKLERTFEHRGHLCLVFESLSMNLREVVKRFGKDVGLNIKAVRAYAHQLFLALSLLKKANVMHADIKPDNILVNEQKTMLKLCDLGSASDASENEVTPYLVSRFYRAPEIILGVPYDPSLDIWSIGCTLYELYTGKILFPGRSNSHMLLLMMEVKGRFNSKMIKRAKFGDKYFDSLGNLLPSALDDGITATDESAASRSARLSSGKPVRDLKTKILGGSSVKKMKEEEVRVLTSFVDLLEKCLTLDPGRRITPREALVHPFIRG